MSVDFYLYDNYQLTFKKVFSALSFFILPYYAHFLYLFVDSNNDKEIRACLFITWIAHM